MGEYKSGKWILILLIYFATFYLITSSIIMASIETTGNDPQIGFRGETDFQTLLDPFETGGICSGTPSYSCSHLNDNTSCEFIRGCNFVWNNNVSGICVGSIGDPDTGFALSICKPNLNYTYCTLAGCSWETTHADTINSNTYNSESNVDISTFRKTISVMMGFGVVGLDMPVWVSWGFQFFFFWIPFLMLMWAIYMALPFAH